MIIRCIQFIALYLVSISVYGLSPSEIFAKVKNSVVVVVVIDNEGEASAFGSGVFLPSGKVATNCHVVESAASIQISQNDKSYPAALYGGDIDRDICLLTSPSLLAVPVNLGNAATLNVGDAVFAVGSPKGLDLTLSDGIVSALRGGFPPTIQTTAAISKGSSGGGLFDSQARLVGITTLYIDDGQNLNFAMPVEWINQIKPITQLQNTSGPKVESKWDSKWADQANKLDNAKNWSGLLSLANRWKAAEPENDSAWFAAGSAYHALGKYDLAIIEFVKAIKIDPDYAPYWKNLGSSLVYKDELVDALTAFTKAASLDANDSYSLFMIGAIENQNENYSKALNALQKAVGIQPENSVYWLELGNSYKHLELIDKASNAFEQAYRINPRDIDVINAISQDKINNNFYQQAFNYAQTAIQIDPKNEESWFLKGTANFKLKRYQLAIQDFLKSIDINPRYSNAWFNLSLSYFLNNQHVEAIQAYQALKKLDPESAPDLYEIVKP